MSAVNSAVARAVDTGFRAAQARKATFGEAVSQTEKAGWGIIKNQLKL